MFGRVSKQDIESAAEVEQRSSPRSLQRQPAHCLRRSYFSEYSFARFRLCFVRTAPTAGGTEQCLPIGVMRPFRRFRSCLSAACCLLPATHIPMAFLSRPRSKPCCCLWEEFFWQNKKHVALGVKEDLEAERNAVAIRTKHNHTILREKRLK